LLLFATYWSLGSRPWEAGVMRPETPPAKLDASIPSSSAPRDRNPLPSGGKGAGGEGEQAQGVSTFGQRQMGHACEWETSMILRLNPAAVGNLDILGTVEFGNPFEPASRGWITKDRTVPGHIGSPQLATAAKGEVLFCAFADDVVQLLERVIRWDGSSWNG